MSRTTKAGLRNRGGDGVTVRFEVEARTRPSATTVSAKRDLEDATIDACSRAAELRICHWVRDLEQGRRVVYVADPDPVRP